MFKKLFGTLSKSLSKPEVITCGDGATIEEQVKKPPEPILEFELDTDEFDENPDPEPFSDGLHLDKTAPLVYIFTVDENGGIGLSFKCVPGYEIDFGSFLSRLMTGALNEEIVSALKLVLQSDSLEKVMTGLGPVVTDFDNDYDEQPLISPSKVFHGVERT